MNDSSQKKYPLLDGILTLQGLTVQPMYTTRDVAGIFDVCVRAIQNWITKGQLRITRSAGTLALPSSRSRGLPQQQQEGRVPEVSSTTRLRERPESRAFRQLPTDAVYRPEFRSSDTDTQTVSNLRVDSRNISILGRGFEPNQRKEMHI